MTNDAVALVGPSVAWIVIECGPADASVTANVTWPVVPAAGCAIWDVMPATGVALRVTAFELPAGRWTVTVTEAGVPSGTAVSELAESEIEIGAGSAGAVESPPHETSISDKESTTQQLVRRTIRMENSQSES
jgi:hypothetical protein